MRNATGLCCPLGSSFNGATGLNPWRSFKTGCWTCKAGMLQWGHGVEPVEMRKYPDKYEVQFPLQWGHGVEPVEMRKYPDKSEVQFPLQWGHGVEPVEIVVISL